MVTPLVVSHINWDWCVEGGEEVVRTCESKEQRGKGHK